MQYVYIIKSQRDTKLYIGVTNDLQRRLEEHNSGRTRSTKHRVPFTLVYYKACLSKADAIRREKNLKGFKNSYTQLKNRISESIDSA